MASHQEPGGPRAAPVDENSGAVPDRRMIGALLRIPREATVRRVLDGLAASGFGDVRTAHFTIFQHMPPDGIRLTALADAALLTKQSTAYLVDDLEALGYLERAPDPTDRRAKVLRLTERGRAVDGTVRATIRQIEVDWASQLGEASYLELTRLLRALITMLEAEERRASPVAKADHTSGAERSE